MSEVKITFSENVPSKDFKSKRFSIEIAEQVQDPKNISRCVQDLFDHAKREVAIQIAQANGKPAVNSNGVNPASQKQIAAIFAIGKALNMSRENIENFSGVTIEQAKLNSRDASKIIEYLKSQQRKAA